MKKTAQIESKSSRPTLIKIRTAVRGGRITANHCTTIAKP